MDTFTDIRKRAGLTQVELAELARVPQGTISAIEHGLRPSQRVQKRLAAALAVEQTDLWPDPAATMEGAFEYVRSTQRERLDKRRNDDA